MNITRRGSAAWSGGLRDGKGSVATESGALAAHPYGYAARFEGVRGTNPEELIGAAHAACFTMSLSRVLGDAGLVAERMETRAAVTLALVDGAFSISSVHLDLVARIPGADRANFERLAAAAKAGCPVSKVLGAPITLETRLEE
jgi:osmotically inducible protein OsmC